MNPLQYALQYYGLTEQAIGSNMVINYMFEDLGHPGYTDETAWCAVFVGYCLEKCGIHSTRKLDARSYLGWGIDTINPQSGDLVIFWREDPESWLGHVGFFISQTPDAVYVLGGNQNNQVNITAYPKSRLLGYRKLSAVDNIKLLLKFRRNKNYEFLR